MNVTKLNTHCWLTLYLMHSLHSYSVCYKLTAKLEIVTTHFNLVIFHFQWSFLHGEYKWEWHEMYANLWSKRGICAFLNMSDINTKAYNRQLTLPDRFCHIITNDILWIVNNQQEPSHTSSLKPMSQMWYSWPHNSSSHSRAWYVE